MTALHEHAVELRSRELAEAMAEVDREVTQYVQITACDLIGWAYRIAEQSRGSVPSAKKLTAIEPDPGSSLHRFWGASWARNRLTHGDAELLSLVVSNEIDQSFSSSEILFSDKEVTFDGDLARDRTLRFAEVAREIPGDLRPDLQTFYNKCVAGRRVAVVAGFLAGEPTLAGD